MYNSVKNQLFRINITLCSLIVATTLFELPAVTSVLFYASFIISLAIFFTSLHGDIGYMQYQTLMVLTLIVVCGLVSVVPGDLSFNYLKKFIVYITTLCTFFSALSIQTEQKTVKTILFESLFLSLLCIYRSFQEDSFENEKLVLHFSNPNFAGMWLMLLAALDVFLLFFLKKGILKFLVLAIIGYLLYLCYLTNARNVWISMAMFVVIAGAIMLKKKNTFRKRTIFLMCIFPLIFALVYLAVTKNGGFGDTATEIFSSEGKNMDSRLAIWEKAFSQFGKKPVFGAYSLEKVVGFQYHNTHVDALAAYGVIGFILFVKYMYNILIMAQSRGTKYNLVVLMCFVSTVIFMGMGEASLFSTGMGMYIFCAAFLLLGSFDFKSAKKTKQTIKEAE